MRVTSLVVAVASHTDKIWKNRCSNFERGKILLQNSVLNLAFWLSQSSGITFES